MRSLLLALVLLHCMVFAFGQSPATYALVQSDPLYRQVAIDLGGGNTCYAFERLFGWDSTRIELMWTAPDQSITNAAAYGLSSPYYHLTDAVRLSDGFLMSGWILGATPMLPSFFKVDDLGSIQWHRSIGVMYHQDRSRGLILPHGASFTTYAFGAGVGYYGAARIEGENTGAMWSGVYMVPPGNLHYELYGAVPTEDATVHLAFGSSVDLDDPDLPNFKTMLMGTADTGAIWMKRYSMPSQHVHPNDPLDLIRTTDGDYVCSGTFGMNMATDRGYVMKVDPSGDVLWCRVYADDSGFLQLESVVELPSGDLLVAGHNTSYECVLLRLAPTGEMIWQRRSTLPWDVWHPIGRFLMNDVGELRLGMQGRIIGFTAEGDACDFVENTSVTDSVHMPVVTSVMLTNVPFVPTVDPLPYGTRPPALAWEQTCLFSGIAEPSGPSLSAFPVPTEDRVYLDGVHDRDRVIVRSIDGVLHYDGPYGGAVQLEARSPGIYAIWVPRSQQHVLVVRR